LMLAPVKEYTPQPLREIVNTNAANANGGGRS